MPSIMADLLLVTELPVGVQRKQHFGHGYFPSCPAVRAVVGERGPGGPDVAAAAGVQEWSTPPRAPPHSARHVRSPPPSDGGYGSAPARKTPGRPVLRRRDTALPWSPRRWETTP